jgi:hypothetical protein
MVRSIVLRISTAGVVVLTAWAMVMATGSSATATQGQAMIAGQMNSETNVTVVKNTNVSVTCNPLANDGLLGCGDTGVRGSGATTGVLGSGISYGVSGNGGTTGVYGFGYLYGIYAVTGTGTAVYASSDIGTGTYAFSGTAEGVVGQSDSNNGVHGLTNGSGTSGVWGENEGGGYGVSGSTHGTSTAGVWGSNSQSGMGVKGTSSFGTGVYASGGGAGLQVVGKALFSRSGIATVTATKSKVKVSNVALDSASLVLATIQGNVAGTWVRGVTTSVGTSSFTIFLNKTVGANTKVAWFIVN